MKTATVRSCRFIRELLPSLALLIFLYPGNLRAQVVQSITASNPAQAVYPSPAFEQTASLDLYPDLFTDSTNLARNKKKRLAWVTAANIVFYGGSLIALNAAWYKNYPRSSFHTFNDSREWLQVYY